MSLLQDVQNAAIDASVPISTLLRKCAVLATRLNNDELWAWVAKELNGYKSVDDVPDYRIIGAPATGHLAGPFRSGYQNIIIPPILLPDWGRKFAEEVRFTQPIATIEDLGKEDELVSYWPGNLTAYMQTKKGNKFANGLVLYSAWQTVPKPACSVSSTRSGTASWSSHCFWRRRLPMPESQKSRVLSSQMRP